MRKRFPFAFVAVLLIFSACAAQKINRSTPKLSYVEMWRTACFGKCPVYKIEVFEDGLVRYTGMYFTPDSGIYQKNIGTEKARTILNKFAEKRVDTLQNDYEANIADLPGIQYTFRISDTVKHVRHAEFGPFFLKELANDLDLFVRSNPDEPPHIDAGWHKVSSGIKGE